ncbi:MAG TPA: hypothetical protein VNS63_16490 [Blastocatellia bacterium]|nr:hypothetical protein [Blastocatellia bacterium]
MKSTHNKVAVVVLAQAVKSSICLEQAGAVMRVPAFPRFDQTARNGT